MHWSRYRLRLCVCICLVISAPISGSSGPKQLTIFSDAASFSLPVREQGGREYVDLMEILRRFGRTDTRSDHDRWRVTLNNLTVEFKNGKTRFKVGKSDADLSAPFYLENGMGYVTVDSLTTLLPLFLQTQVTLHQNSRRLFVGNPAVHFTAQTSGTALVLNFSSAVNPSISTEPGKLRMSFSREPLVAPGTERLSFDSKVIPSAVYSEENGTAAITVNGSAPLFARFSNDGRTINISPAPQGAAQAASTPTVNQGNAPAAPPQAPAPASSPIPFVPVFAVIDPAHGGDDQGEQLSPQLAEKDVTLAIATRIRQELQARGMTAVLLRSSDITLAADQRASAANRSQATVYIAVHAVSLGSGVRVYTSLLPASGDSRGPFLDWQTAQSGYRTFSQAAAESVAAEVSRRQMKSRTLVAPLQPLNNLEMASVAVELAPRSTIADLNSPNYQQTLAESVAAGLAAAHDRLRKP
jgi:N-acetylmuramoyl-L-alanine amidase